MAESLRWSPEPTTTLVLSYTPNKRKQEDVDKGALLGEGPRSCRTLRAAGGQRDRARLTHEGQQQLQHRDPG